MILAGEINRIEDWYYKAGPKDKDSQWKDDYSAKEFAKLWFTKSEDLKVPNEIRELVERNFGKFDVLFAFPEHVTKLDGFSGGHRNHDMFSFCKKQNGEDFVICMEAKVAEPLDMTIGEKIKSVEKKDSSKIPLRIKGMQNMLNMENKNIDNLRYQLFTGTVGTINECKKYNNIDGLFLILQIMPKRNENEKISSNLSDIKSFLNENNAETFYEDEKSLLSKIHSKEQNINMYLGYLRIQEA